jgi:hypothetical protein
VDCEEGVELIGAFSCSVLFFRTVSKLTKSKAEEGGKAQGTLRM